MATAGSPGQGSPAQGSPAQAAPLAGVPPPPADPAAAAAGADALPPPPPPIADTGEAPAAAQPEGAAIQPAPGTFVTTTAADAPVAQVMIDPNKKEGPKKEFMAAVKSYEEIVGGNVIRGKMYLESKPQYEAGGPMGMGGGGYDRPMGMGYPGPTPYPPPMGMGGYDRPPMGYEGQMGGYGYDRPPMGGYGYDRPPLPPPPDMYGPPRDRMYSPDRNRYSPDYDRPPMDRRERPRNQRDDEYYYDELPKGRSETKVPVKKESENRAERVIQKIRQDIEAFDKDEGAVEDATNVPGSKPSESMERKPRAGPARALWKATDDYEDEPPPARRSPRQRSSSHRSRDEVDDYDDYDDKRRSRRKRSKTRYDYDDEDRPRRGRSRRDESSSSSSSDGRRQRRKRRDSDDYDRGRSPSRRRRDSEDYGDKRAKRSRSRSKRRDEEEDDARASSRQRKGKGGEGLVSRPTEDRNFMQAGMLYRYESQPLMLVKGDVYKKEEAAAAPAPEAGQEGGPKVEEGAQQARFLSPDQYQDFLLGVRAGRRPLGYPVRATPSAVAEELGRYHDFLGSVMPDNAPREAMAAEVGKYHSFILGTANAALRGTSPEREKKFTEFLLATEKGVARVIKPAQQAEAAQGAAGIRPPPGYQAFTVQAKPTVVPKPPVKEEVEPPPPQYHGFAVQAKPAPPPPPPEPELDDAARRASSDNMFTMQTRPQRMKGERYEHMEDTPQLKTEWWSRTAGAYDDMRPPSRSRSVRGRRGLARSASPRMVSPRRKAYDDENGDAYQVTSLEMEGPMSNQFAQMRISRRGRDPNRMHSMTRRISPTAAGYGGPPRRASPEMIGMGGMGGGMQGMPMQGMQMQGMQMTGMQGMQMQGVPMQGMSMQGMPMQGMPMQPMGMQPMGMPMQGMPMQAMPMQGMPVQYDPRSGRVPMRMDRRIQQMLSQQPPGGRYNVPPMQVAAAMPVQAQDGVMFKYQIQNESRQRQSDEGDGKGKEPPATRDVLIETSKEVSVEKIVSSQEVQVAEKKMSKATSARVKTRSSAAATHDAGSKKNAEAQAEIEEQIPHVGFTRNPNYDSPPPGYPFPMGPFAGQSPMFPPPAPPPQPVHTVSSTIVHTHQHHHHYHDAQKNYKIAYMLPKSGDVRKLAQDRYEDQEPLGAAVGVQCLSLYERFMNWIYPETKQTEDVSLMTDADELCDDKKRPGKKGKKGGKKGEKDADGKSEESKKGDKKGSESEAESKAKPTEGEDKEKKEGEGEEEKKKVPPGPPIPVNLPWQGHEYEYEEEIKPDGSRVGKYRYKGLGGAPKLPEEGATESIAAVSSKEPVTFETTTTRMESDGQYFWQREIKPIPAEARMEAMMPMKQMTESRESYQRQMRQHPSQRSVSGPQRRVVQTTRKVPRAMERGAVAKAGGADNFVPDVQIRLDFGDTSENSGSRGSKTTKSEAWQPADMVVSYAHKSFDDKHATDDEDEDDDDDEMLPSGHSYGGHGSTKKLIRRGRKMRGMPNKELMAYSMVVLVAVVGLALLITMTGHRSLARQTFGLDRHLVLNASKFKAAQAVPGGNAFWNAAPAVCKDARCLTKGSAAVRHLPRDYLRSACSDFYQFVCAHHNATDYPRMVARRALEDGVLGVIKAQEKYPELMTARHLYKECLNKEAISERGWDPLAELQESTDLSGWPFTDPVQQPLVWRAAGRTLRRFSLAALLSLGVERHPHKHGANILSVGHPELLLPTSLGNRSVKWYYGAVMHALAPFRERIVTPVFAVEVSAFESRLANLVRSQPRMAVERLAERPELAEFLSVALENITRVTKSTEFLVKDVDYVNDLVAAIKETAPHIVLNYLGFRQVVVASPFLPSKLQALSALGRSPALRKEICLAVVAESLPVMSLYAGFNAFKQGLNNFKTANISGATKDVVSSFVKKMSWMDDVTKANVAKKVLNSHVKTFHPSWISDKFKVFAQHENVPMVTENEGLRSYAVIRKALFENTLKAEAAHIDERWIGTILDPQCSFDAQGTSIYAPVSFWNVSSPSTDNFLMMHMPDTVPRLSHCLMTMLLREGGDLDNENPYSKPLWTATTKKHFNNVRHCFANQLSGTASENASTTELLSVVADAAALSPSFKIYKRFVSQKNIDGKSFEKTLNMNVDQFFFVSYASSYCGNPPPAKPSHHSEVTNHDRVNTALRNSPEFQAAFRCPSTRAMNPEHKCHLWRTS